MKRHYQPEKSTEKIVRSAFFKRDPLTCARELIGTELIWGECSGVVVEVEAYAAIDDEAAHTFTRPSARSFIERNKAGAAYVYFNYGVHWMLNVLVKGDANGFVLIRALEPRRGVELMKRRRGINDLRQLCSGPGKLTQAFAITGRDHEMDLCCRSAPLLRLQLTRDFRCCGGQTHRHQPLCASAVAIYAARQQFVSRAVKRRRRLTSIAPTPRRL